MAAAVRFANLRAVRKISFMARRISSMAMNLPPAHTTNQHTPSRHLDRSSCTESKTINQEAIGYSVTMLVDVLEHVARWLLGVRFKRAGLRVYSPLALSMHAHKRLDDHSSPPLPFKPLSQLMPTDDSVHAGGIDQRRGMHRLGQDCKDAEFTHAATNQHRWTFLVGSQDLTILTVNKM
jgi:hypothetical protein